MRGFRRVVSPATSRLLPSLSASSIAARENSSLAQILYDAPNMDALALAAPAQRIEWSYHVLANYTGRLAGGLATMGYKRGDVICTDLASCAENLLLQLAASHLGVTVFTCRHAKDLNDLGAKLQPLGAVVTDEHSFLKDATKHLAIPSLFVSALNGERTFGDIYNRRGGRPNPVALDASDPVGYYASEKPVTIMQVMECGAAAQKRLQMTEQDVVLVSITLNHLFGIGSAVNAALRSGATIVLPDASGVVGCGSPSQRAQATLEYLDAFRCTLLFADTHTLKALTALQPAELGYLRGGVCKIGSGTTFLDKTVDLAGVPLQTMGKA